MCMYIPKYILVYFYLFCVIVHTLYTCSKQLNKEYPGQLYMKAHQSTWGESITVCAWGNHFPLHNEGQLEHLLQHSAQSTYLCYGYQALSHQKQV